MRQIGIILGGILFTYVASTGPCGAGHEEKSLSSEDGGRMEAKFYKLYSPLIALTWVSPSFRKACRLITKCGVRLFAERLWRNRSSIGIASTEGK